MRATQEGRNPMSDWRTAPDPRRCTKCRTPETSCEAGRLFSARPCCADCSHTLSALDHDESEDR